MICPACKSNNADFAVYCSGCGTHLKSEGQELFSEWCYSHSDRATALKCGSCERAICVQCVVQHPVGIRCRECARMRVLPQHDVSPSYFARAIGVSMSIGFAGAVGLSLLTKILPIGVWGILVGLIGVGYLVGEGISRVVNRKQSRGLQYIAGSGVLFSALLLGGILKVIILGSLNGLLALAVAIYVAVSRLRIR